tara:strand:- start:2049 stop:3185 length:1137 start_codon:yes stop_codon:yes gene_type:complete
MFKKITERIFPFLIALSALSVSASAAFYSVSGLSKLFAGATFEVIVMAGSLEVAKLVIASLLYQYRKTLPILLKGYLIMACTVLILITSMGIYGFLSAAYQETSNKEGNLSSKIELLETKRDNIREQLEVYTEEKSSINGAIEGLRNGLSNNTIQYKDRETGQIITTTSSSTRKALERQLDQAIERQTEVNLKVDDLNTKIFDYESEIVETRIGDGTSGELGPLKYLSGLTGISMDRIINYLLLVIIFVFDPLAISLVIAANFAFEKLKTKERKLYVKQENWIDENQNQNKKEEVVTEPQPQEINPNKTVITNLKALADLKKKMDQIKNEKEISELQTQIDKINTSETHEKRRNLEITQIQSQIKKIKDNGGENQITY